MYLFLYTFAMIKKVTYCSLSIAKYLIAYFAAMVAGGYLFSLLCVILCNLILHTNYTISDDNRRMGSCGRNAALDSCYAVFLP